MTVGCTFSHAAAHAFLLHTSFFSIFTMLVKGIWQVRRTTEFGQYSVPYSEQLHIPVGRPHNAN